MRYSKKDREWFQQLEERGIKSKKMAPAPEVFEDMKWIWRAFNTLCGSRHCDQNGLPEKISLSEIAAYCQLYRIKNDDNIEQLIETVQSLDEVLIDDAVAKYKLEMDRKKK